MRHIPINSTEIINEEAKLAFYTYQSGDKFIVLCYGGRRKKPDFHYSYPTEDARDNKINEHTMFRLETIKGEKDRKAAIKIEEANKFKDIKVGDVFHSAGGYDQTNCHFYQLVELKGKTGTFRAIGSDVVDGSEAFMSCQKTPAVNEFYGEPMKLRITGDRIKPGYECAYKTDPTKSHYNSWYA